MLLRIATILLCFLLPFANAQGQSPNVSSWPQFRGPNGMGVATASGLPTRFDEQEHLVWKTKVPGTGWSSPVLTPDHVWLTAAVGGGQRTERQGAGGKEIAFESIQLFLLGFDRKTGDLQQQIVLFDIPEPGIIHSLNSYASPTPCVGPGPQGQPVVYCHFGTYGTAAVDATTGDVLWRNEQIHLDHQTGPGSSPILYRNRLIFHADGIDTQSIVALDTSDGKLAWRTRRSGAMRDQVDMRKAFCTPLLTQVDGEDCLISTASDWLYLYDPADGSERLKVPYGKLGFSTVPRPVVKDETVYLCTGFMRSRLLAVDISTSDFQQPSQRIRWAYERQVPTMPSPLLFDECLLMISDSGIATCLEQETGEVIWTERIGGKFAASPLLADEKVYIGNQDGEMLVLRPGREYRLLATNQLDSEIMASPAAVQGRLFVRTADSLYCFAQEN